MKIEKEMVAVTTYQSEKYAEIRSDAFADAEIIEWLDENPVAFNIVTGTRSEAFGRNSCVYIGWAQRNNSVEAIIEKLKTLRAEMQGRGCFRKGPPTMAGTIFHWRAQFTFEHYKDKGFNGGFFQQWKRDYSSDCLTLDYTPEKLEEVVERFIGWCSSDGERVTVSKGKKVVEEFKIKDRKVLVRVGEKKNEKK